MKRQRPFAWARRRPRSIPSSIFKTDRLEDCYCGSLCPGVVANFVFAGTWPGMGWVIQGKTGWNPNLVHAFSSPWGQGAYGHGTVTCYTWAWGLNRGCTIWVICWGVISDVAVQSIQACSRAKATRLDAALLHPSLQLESCMGAKTMSGTNTQLYLPGETCLVGVCSIWALFAQQGWIIIFFFWWKRLELLI